LFSEYQRCPSEILLKIPAGIFIHEIRQQPNTRVEQPAPVARDLLPLLTASDINFSTSGAMP
jgi:hypothetical protein